MSIQKSLITVADDINVVRPKSDADWQMFRRTQAAGLGTYHAMNKDGVSEKLGGDLPTYEVYTALITQEALSAPVATILENKLSGDIVWIRTSTGQYQGTLLGAFPAGKTFIVYPPYNENSGNGDEHFVYRADNNTIEWGSYRVPSTEDDGLILNHSLEIRVYP